MREVMHGAQAKSVTEALAQEGPVPKKTLAISPDLKLPLDAVTRRIGILGMSGSGKTTTAAVFTEEILKQQLPTAIIDPKDDFWGLRAGRDGKSEGLPIIVLGGEHGDAQLEETAGKLIADMVVDEAPQLVLSMAHFSKSAMKRFATDFFERLYHRNREALNVIVDEADLFAPQHVPKGDGLRLFGALDDLVRRGRKRGIGVTMICQRSSIINKDILTQCELLVAHRASHPLDIDPVVTWMRAARMPEEKLVRVQDEIAKLANGEAWVMSPHWLEKFARVQIRDRETFDSSATPEAGKRRIEPKALAKIDLDILTRRMAETIERAKATDPKFLRQRIAELEKQVAAKVPPPPAPAAAKEKRVEVPIIKDAQIKRLEALGARVHDAVLKLNEAGVAIYSTAKHQLPMGRPPEPPPRPQAVRPAQPVRAVAPPRPRPEANGSAEGIGAGERRMLEALGRRHPQPLTRDQLGTLSGFAAGGGTFRNYVAHLKREGLVEESIGNVSLTPNGEKEVAHVIGTAQSPEEVRAMWKQSLGAGEWRMVEVLLDQGGEPITREKLGELSGFEASGGTFRNYAAKIKRVGLAVEEHGGIRVVEELIG